MPDRATNDKENTMFALKIKKTLGLLAIGTMTVAGLGLQSPAGAYTNASAKVCAYNQQGTAESGAALTSYRWTGSSWAKYATAKAGPGGCGWVAVPQGLYSYVNVYRAPAISAAKYTVSEYCSILGYFPYDWANTPFHLVPAGTGGINFGTVSTSVYTLNC